MTPYVALLRGINVGGKNIIKLAPALEKALAARFKYKANLVLRSAAQMQSVLKKAPKGFGSQPQKFRYDVIFLKDLDPKALLPKFPLKPGVDQAWAGPDCLYCTRLVAKAGQSRISKITGMEEYQRMTIRNWNTTMALVS
jgi:uncharacterized protein (DUF1697 family)